MRKKQKTGLIVLIIVLFLCIGGYLGVKSLNQKNDEIAAAQVDYVARIASASKLSVTRHGEPTITFVKDSDGNWTYPADTDFVVDSSTVAAIERGLVALESTRTLTAPDSLADYGLEEPGITLEATAEDGEELTIQFGIPIGLSRYYAKYPGDDRIFSVENDIYEAMDHKLSGFAVVEELPYLSHYNVRHVKLTVGDDVYELDKTNEPKEIEKTYSTGQFDENGEPITYTQTVTQSEYHWYRANGTEMTKANRSESEEDLDLDEMLDSLAYMEFFSCYDFKPDEEAVASYGLDDPIKLEVTYNNTPDNDHSKDAVMTLYIGDSNGHRRYWTRLEDSPFVCFLEADYADDFLAMQCLPTNAELGR